MKPIMMILIACMYAFAIDIDVVKCNTVLKNDMPPGDHILYGTVQAIKEHPSDFICAYRACDFHHTEGWFAVRKDKSLVFIWLKSSNRTMTWQSEYDDQGFILYRTNIDKYGIRDTGGWRGNYAHDIQDNLVEVLLSEISECN